MAYLTVAREPKQLHIVDDTELRHAMAANRQPSNTTPDLSTDIVGRSTPDLSTCAKPKTTPDLSTADLRRFDARRRTLRIAIPRLCAAAGIYTDTYELAKSGRSQMRPQTFAKLNAALNRLAAGQEGNEPRTLCVALVRLVTAQVARAVGADPAKVLATDLAQNRSNAPDWLQASRCRRCAVYLVVEGLGLRKAAIGHALGITRAAAQKIVKEIERERDHDAALDALLAELMTTLKGEA